MGGADGPVVTMTRRDGVSPAVNIRPGVGIIGLFPHMNYKPWFALAELVDNALASYLQNRDRLAAVDGEARLRVVIEVTGQDGGRIRVWDNAGGIATPDFHRAFVAAEPPADTTGLSQFGIGMKSASCWFARRWQARTTALDEMVERTVAFDVPQIVEQGIEELIASERPANPDSHYTELSLWDLHKPPQGRTVSKMASHLASMYRMFLDRGDVEISFNGEVLSYPRPAVLVARPYDEADAEPVSWEKTISFTLPTGESVSGFAAIRETGSVAKAGFSLFRHQRLIVGSDEESYRPPEVFGSSNKYRYQRIFGELHLDGFDVSHTKDGFLWGEREGVFLDMLRAQLDAPPLPLLRQAENYRSRAISRSQRMASGQALTNTARAVGDSAPQLAAQVAAEATEEELPSQQPKTEDLDARTLTVDVGGRPWEVVIELTTDPAHTDWVSIADEPLATDRPRRLGIRVSLTHPFMLQFAGTTADEIEPLLRVAAALALAEITARESGATMAGAVRRNINELLRGSLAQP